MCSLVMNIRSRDVITIHLIRYLQQSAWFLVVHKRMSILTFKGLSTTFEASTNVYFTYFVIKLNVIMVIYVLKLPAQCFLLITKQLDTRVQLLAI